MAEKTRYYQDGTQVMVQDIPRTKVGTLREWVALLRGGYPINGQLVEIDVDVNPEAVFGFYSQMPDIHVLTPRIRNEIIADDLQDEEILEYLNNHAVFFAQLRQKSQG